jgi:hypothetical protein
MQSILQDKDVSVILEVNQGHYQVLIIQLVAEERVV